MSSFHPLFVAVNLCSYTQPLIKLYIVEFYLDEVNVTKKNILSSDFMVFFIRLLVKCSTWLCHEVPEFLNWKFRYLS